MTTLAATAVANPNIAFIKYWGNRLNSLRLPANGSISMNLAGLFTKTKVTFSSENSTDSLVLNEKIISGTSLERVSVFLDFLRQIAGNKLCAVVTSENNFPIGAGIASSAAAFAALGMAASAALGLNLTESELSRVARRGSGSACRSVPAGYVEWLTGKSDNDSYAISIAPPDYWNLTDIIAIVKSTPKTTGSTEGHALASSSPLQRGRILDAPRRLDRCRHAILDRDFQSLAEIIEQDSTMMHAVMMTSQPPLFYWETASLQIMREIPLWRKQGIPVAFTLDAGPNVHLICPSEYADVVQAHCKEIEGVKYTLLSTPGGAAHLIQ